jgi:hypothetical protein
VTCDALNPRNATEESGWIPGPDTVSLSSTVTGGFVTFAFHPCIYFKRPVERWCRDVVLQTSSPACLVIMAWNPDSSASMRGVARQCWSYFWISAAHGHGHGHAGIIYYSTRVTVRKSPALPPQCLDYYAGSVCLVSCGLKSGLTYSPAECDDVVVNIVFKVRTSTLQWLEIWSHFVSAEYDNGVISFTYFKYTC